MRSVLPPARAQCVDGLRQGVQERIDLRLGRLAAERDADRAVDERRIDAHGLKHMAAVPLAARAARRDADVAILKGVDEPL